MTEDAHTALKLNRLGYNTAYLAIPQAAGLATESLSGHIGQRIRWARGMAQIARVDNPLFGSGLRLGQRLCYLNAMLHFFYGLPRLIFMTAPLAYLFFGAHVFQATGMLIASFAMPHLLHANLTNSRMQGRFRHSFWNEVYESVLAWYILRPVLVAFINPKLGKFNVTAKGGVVQNAYFDWSIARPYVLVVLLNLVGLAMGVWQLMHAEGTVASTLMINMAWTIYNVVIASASIAVASETRQVRQSPRVITGIRASLALGDGHVLACQAQDFSQTGVGLTVPAEIPIALGDLVQVGLFRSDEEAVFPATVAFRQGDRLGVQFDGLTTQQHIELAQLTFARADNWAVNWGDGRRDAPLAALRDVARVGALGFSLLFIELYRRAMRRPGADVAASPKLDTGN